jgi:hypothetical protein
MSGVCWGLLTTVNVIQQHMHVQVVDSPFQRGRSTWLLKSRMMQWMEHVALTTKLVRVC